MAIPWVGKIDDLTGQEMRTFQVSNRLCYHIRTAGKVPDRFARELVLESIHQSHTGSSSRLYPLSTAPMAHRTGDAAHSDDYEPIGIGYEACCPVGENLPVRELTAMSFSIRP